MSGLQYVCDCMKVCSPLGKSQLLHFPFLLSPDAIQRELDRVENQMVFVRENPGAEVALIMALHEVHDISQTILNLKRMQVLDDIEFFELKKFALNSQKILELVRNQPDIRLCDLSKVVKTLDPEDSKIEHFYIYSVYDSELEPLRKQAQQTDDADYLIVAFGSAARIAQKAIEIAREEGIKVGLFRPITLWPFPSKQIADMARTKKGVLVVEINAGQMVQDVRLAINGEEKVEQFGRLGGIVPEPEEIVNALKTKIM